MAQYPPLSLASRWKPFITHWLTSSWRILLGLKLWHPSHSPKLLFRSQFIGVLCLCIFVLFNFLRLYIDWLIRQLCCITHFSYTLPCLLSLAVPFFPPGSLLISLKALRRQALWQKRVTPKPSRVRRSQPQVQVAQPLLMSCTTPQSMQDSTSLLELQT